MNIDLTENMKIRNIYSFSGCKYFDYSSSGIFLVPPRIGFKPTRSENKELLKRTTVKLACVEIEIIFFLPYNNVIIRSRWNLFI